MINNTKVNAIYTNKTSASNKYKILASWCTLAPVSCFACPFCQVIIFVPSLSWFSWTLNSLTLLNSLERSWMLLNSLDSLELPWTLSWILSTLSNSLELSLKLFQLSWMTNCWALELSKGLSCDKMFKAVSIWKDCSYIAMCIHLHTTIGVAAWWNNDVGDRHSSHRLVVQ